MGFIADRVSELQGSAIRETFKLLAKPDIISFAGGAPAPELFPGAELSEISQKILTDNAAVALQYGVSEGYTPLREYVRARMQNNMHKGDDLIITAGGQQAIDLCAKSLVNEGDVVIAEIPSFIGGLNSFRSYNARLVGVPLESDGMDLDKLEEILKKEKVKLVYTITTFQNPSGITMSEQKRKRLLALAEQYDFYILEDNPYCELRFKGEDIPAIKSFDTEGRVIYAGSFSKTLSAGLRLGWAIAREDILEKMIICKQVSDVHTAVLNQMIAYDFVSKYPFDEHINKSRKLYGEKCALMLSCMDKYFPDFCSFTRPEGGIFLWCTLPEHFDTGKLLKVCIENKVAFVPGTSCAIDPTKPSHEFRLNYSLPSNEKIEKGIQILADVIKNYK